MHDKLWPFKKLWPELIECRILFFCYRFFHNSKTVWAIVLNQCFDFSLKPDGFTFVRCAQRTDFLFSILSLRNAPNAARFFWPQTSHNVSFHLVYL